MQVQFFMTPDPRVVSPDETVEEAWEMMATIESHHLPVVADGMLVGIISDRDLRRNSDALVGEVMTPDPVTVAPTDRLVEAGQTLLSHQINAVPVVQDGRLVGVLTTTNCLIAMIQLNHELELSRS